MEFIDNQNIFGNMPYGNRGTVAENGCGSVACYNALIYLGNDIDYSEVHSYFNRNNKVLFKGRWGTNPFSVKRYLSKNFGLRIKMHFFRISKIQPECCIILYIYKHKKNLCAHYIFSHMEGTALRTYNLNNTYPSIKKLIEKENVYRKLVVIYEIKRKQIMH